MVLEIVSVIILGLLAIILLRKKMKVPKKENLQEDSKRMRIVDNRGRTVGYADFIDGRYVLYDREEKKFMVNPKGNIEKIFKKRISEKHLEKLTKLRYGIKGE